MTQVGLLTPEQSAAIKDTEFEPTSFFNPIQDKHGNWVISIQEIERCDIEWVKELQLIEFEPIEIDLDI
jgi:hypothetical protein